VAGVQLTAAIAAIVAIAVAILAIVTLRTQHTNATGSEDPAELHAPTEPQAAVSHAAPEQVDPTRIAPAAPTLEPVDC
jgi:hypothetical protein